jgi:hypothetical protein
MTKTEPFLVIELDQEIVRFNERLCQLRALSPEQRLKRILARLCELCNARNQQRIENANIPCL